MLLHCCNGTAACTRSNCAFAHSIDEVVLTNKPSALRVCPPVLYPAPEYGLHLTNFFGFIGHDGNLPGFSTSWLMIPLATSRSSCLRSDGHCEAPADTIVKLIIQELDLLSQ